MAIIGFIVVVLGALYMLKIGISLGILGLAFETHQGWFAVVPIGISAYLFYLACTMAPFTLNLVSK